MHRVDGLRAASDIAELQEPAARWQG